MKRLYMAAGLVIICVILCICEIKTVNAKTNTYTENLNIINELVSEGRYDEATTLATDTLANWKKTARKLDVYLYHDYVDSITLSMSAIPIYTRNEISESTRTAVENIKIQLASLRESELPYVHNIL